MDQVTTEELKTCVRSVARGCKGCPTRGTQCGRCDRFQCRMLVERMDAPPLAPPGPQKAIAQASYASRVFKAGKVRTMGRGAYPDGMPCKTCGDCLETGGCTLNPIKERCKRYRVWRSSVRAAAAKAQRAALAAEDGGQRTEDGGRKAEDASASTGPEEVAH